VFELASYLLLFAANDLNTLYKHLYQGAYNHPSRLPAWIHHSVGRLVNLTLTR